MYNDFSRHLILMSNIYFYANQDIHTSLRKAAGLINFVKDTLIPQLIEKPVSGSDLDVRVVSAYLNQCTAEAQEGKNTSK